MKKMLGIMFFWIVISTLLFAEEVPGKNKKFRLSICSIFKNESRFLKEWIEYHLLIGVEHFYLYNNNSKDRYLEVLEPYIKKGVVSLIHWPDYLGHLKEENMFLWSLSTQMPAYENAIKYTAAKDTQWLALVDINEFIVPPNNDNLIEILEKYNEFPGITLISDFYDAYKWNSFPRKKLLIETTQLIGRPYFNPANEVEKIIFKPEFYGGSTWPPYTPRLRHEHAVVKLRKPEMRIHYYANKNAGLFYFGKTKYPFKGTFSEEEITELLDKDYEIEDQDSPIYRFIPKLLERMGLSKNS